MLEIRVFLTLCAHFINLKDFDFSLANALNGDFDDDGNDYDDDDDGNDDDDDDNDSTSLASFSISSRFLKCY